MCLVVVCKPITSITNGSVVSPGQRDVLRLNDYVEFKCAQGHILYGSARLVCIGPNEYDRPVPMCNLGTDFNCFD